MGATAGAEARAPAILRQDQGVLDRTPTRSARRRFRRSQAKATVVLPSTRRTKPAEAHLKRDETPSPQGDSVPGFGLPAWGVAKRVQPRTYRPSCHMQVSLE